MCQQVASRIIYVLCVGLQLSRKTAGYMGFFCIMEMCLYICYLKWAMSALRDLWFEVWGVKLLIKHEAKTSAL